jgi:hypothetical protein
VTVNDPFMVPLCASHTNVYAPGTKLTSQVASPVPAMSVTSWTPEPCRWKL